MIFEEKVVASAETSNLVTISFQERWGDNFHNIGDGIQCIWSGWRRGTSKFGVAAESVTW